MGINSTTSYWWRGREKNKINIADGQIVVCLRRNLINKKKKMKQLTETYFYLDVEYKYRSHTHIYIHIHVCVYV